MRHCVAEPLHCEQRALQCVKVGGKPEKIISENRPRPSDAIWKKQTMMQWASHWLIFPSLLIIFEQRSAYKWWSALPSYPFLVPEAGWVPGRISCAEICHFKALKQLTAFFSVALRRVFDDFFNDPCQMLVCMPTWDIYPWAVWDVDSCWAHVFIFCYNG